MRDVTQKIVVVTRRTEIEDLELRFNTRANARFYLARARENLRGVLHAHAHVGSGSDLPQFADSSFDFVYSYAVFQHIPSHDVIWSYLREAHRVLRPGGRAVLCDAVLKPEKAAEVSADPDSWSL